MTTSTLIQERFYRPNKGIVPFLDFLLEENHQLSVWRSRAGLNEDFPGVPQDAVMTLTSTELERFAQESDSKEDITRYR